MKFRTERVLLVTAVLVLGLGLGIALNQTSSSAVGIPQPPSLMLGLALLVVAAIGSAWVRGGVPLQGGTSHAIVRRGSDFALSALLPCSLVGGILLFLPLFSDGIAHALLLVLGGVALGVTYWAQGHSASTSDRYFGFAQSALNLLSHLSVFVLFSVLYGLKTRSLFSATGVGLLTAVFLLELLLRDARWHRELGEPVEARRATLPLLALSGGVVLAQITWGLNYWAALTTLVGGAFLLVAFYVVNGILSHYVERKLNRTIILEFGGVGALGMFAVFVSAFLT